MIGMPTIVTVIVRIFIMVLITILTLPGIIIITHIAVIMSLLITRFKQGIPEQ